MEMKRYDLTAQSDLKEFYRDFEGRRAGVKRDVTASVTEILQKVQSLGDTALYEYTEKFDGVDLRNSGFLVSDAEIDRAFAAVDKDLIPVIEQAAENIRRFHQNEMESSWSLTREEGSSFGIRVSPIERAGVYVPGGSAPLPSSVLMNIIPAKTAGVSEIIMCTPPSKNGSVAPVILAAAKIAGVDRIYKVGGAQAIAAMAYGTESIPKVDKITGPGNAFVATAKRCVFGICGIDMIAGPSEILIVADQTANPDFVAADMLSQAEHDPMAAAVLITTDRTLADAIPGILKEQLAVLSRREIAERSLQDNGAIIFAASEAQAMEICNFIAAEHLELCVAEPERLLQKVKNAGAVFLGNWSPEPMGDYYCGSNHILPTGGSARFSSPLGVWDFLKRTSVIHYSRSGFLQDSEDAALFAASEGLTAHENAIRIREKGCEN